MRERFVRGDESSRSEATLLELLLTHAIPQEDLRPLAKCLLAQYSSLTALLESPIEKLARSDGIKEGSAVLLRLVDWIRQGHAVKRPVKEAPKPAVRATLFEPLPHEKTGQPGDVKDAPRRGRVAQRRGTGMFGKAILKEAIQILPDLPDSESLAEIRSLVRNNHDELSLLRTMPADEDRVLLLRPDRRSRGRIIMFHEMGEGDHTMPTDLIAENHLWEIRE